MHAPRGLPCLSTDFQADAGLELWELDGRHAGHGTGWLHSCSVMLGAPIAFIFSKSRFCDCISRGSKKSAPCSSIVQPVRDEERIALSAGQERRGGGAGRVNIRRRQGMPSPVALAASRASCRDQQESGRRRTSLARAGHGPCRGDGQKGDGAWTTPLGETGAELKTSRIDGAALGAELARGFGMGSRYESLQKHGGADLGSGPMGRGQGMSRVGEDLAVRCHALATSSH